MGHKGQWWKNIGREGLWRKKAQVLVINSQVRLAKVWPIDRIYTKQKKANTVSFCKSLCEYKTNQKSQFTASSSKCKITLLNLFIHKQKNPARVNTVTNSLSWTEPTARWKSAFSTSVSTSVIHIWIHTSNTWVISGYRIDLRDRVKGAQMCFSLLFFPSCICYSFTFIWTQIWNEGRKSNWWVIVYIRCTAYCLRGWWTHLTCSVCKV